MGLLHAVNIVTLSRNYRRIRYANTPDNAYPTMAMLRDTTMGPDGPSYAGKPQVGGTDPTQLISPSCFDLFSIGSGTAAVQNSIKILPFGQWTTGNTFNMAIIGWTYTAEGGVLGTAGWTWEPLAELLCTYGSVAGQPGMLVDNTNNFASTITIMGTTANAGVHINVVSPGAAAAFPMARVTVDLEGSMLIQVAFKNNASTSANALIKEF